MENNLTDLSTENVQEKVISIQTNKLHKIIFYSLISVILVVVFGYVVLTLKSKTSSFNPQITQIKKITKDIKASVTPIPFAELTIPYLRNKKYISKLGELNQVSVGSYYKSFITYYTSDGLRVNGLLTVPNEEMPQEGFPAIVFVHGYIPPAIYSTTSEAYFAYVDYLASSGFVVFKIDLRGHGSSEGEAGGGYYGSDYVSDILHAYNALENLEYVNPKKIGLWGHSMSGNAVLRSMAARPEIPAGVIWAGAVYTYVDMQKYGISDSSYQPPVSNIQRQNRRRELFEKHGSPSAQSVFWKQVAPVNYLTDFKGKVSLHHAIDDAVVNIGYSRDLSELLENASVPHELYEYSTGGHNISGSSFTLAMQRTVEFFKKHL